MNVRTLLPLALVALVGCGGSDVPDFPDTAPVTGTVTQGGKPVEGATITFHPVTQTEGTYAASATSGPDGTYTLSTFFSPAATEEGAVPGDYKVTVRKAPPIDPNAAAAHGDDVVVKESRPTGPANLLPKQYENPSSSPLGATVKAGEENKVPLELK